MDKKNLQKTSERPPVVAVMGHIDHGKSTLLDYIRKTNVVDKEAGGITQSVSAYEVVHKNDKGEEKKITFIDTPGHAAFTKMRERSAKVADIAILIVSAEDGVKPQTIEAYKTIQESNTPFIVAINKIDKPNANIDKTKIELAENEIYLEDYGGKVPFVPISAKTGVGIDDLLSLILILAEMENFTAQKDNGASGLVIEAHLDQKRGIEATLIIKDGTMQKGEVVVASGSVCNVRIMENFLGKAINQGDPSSPVTLVGWSSLPKIGSEFITFDKKTDALYYAEKIKSELKDSTSGKDTETNKKIIPIVLKADVAGSIEAIEKEIAKIQNDQAEFRIINKGVGSINESDIKNIDKDAIVVGFNVKADKNGSDLAMQKGVEIAFFNIIYKMTEWLEQEMEKRRPRIEAEETIGKAKILKTFSRTKEKQIAGGKVVEGNIILNSMVRIIRRENEIGRGKIVNLEKGKTKTSNVEEGTEFGMMIETKNEIAVGDIIEAFQMTTK